MILGFTGTRHGMTDWQKVMLRWLLIKFELLLDRVF